MASLPRLRGYQNRVAFAIIQAAAEHPGETFTVMFPRQAGKNEVSATLLTALLFIHAGRGGSAVVCAPTLHPQAALSLERTVARIRRFAEAARLPFATEGPTIRLGLASATFLSGQPEANVAGHTASLMLIADEAQDLDEDWFNRQFRPMTASTGACTVLFGTPWRGDSLLEKAAARNRARDASRRGRAYTDFLPFHHEVGWLHVERHAGHYGRFVRQEERRLGSNHPVFRSQYLLEPAAAGQGRLLDGGTIDSLTGDFAPQPGPAASERYVAGLDFGGDRATSDATVLTIARVAPGRTEVVALYSWTGEPFGDLTSRLADLAREWRLEALVCDATGIGMPLAAGLRKELGRRVHPLHFTQAEKSALGFELQAAAHTGRLRLARPETPGFAALLAELRVCRAERRAGGQLQWEAPPGRHDDHVVSLALCLRAAALAPGPRIAVGR